MNPKLIRICLSSAIFSSSLSFGMIRFSGQGCFDFVGRVKGVDKQTLSVVGEEGTRSEEVWTLQAPQLQVFPPTGTLIQARVWIEASSERQKPELYTGEESFEFLKDSDFAIHRPRSFSFVRQKDKISCFQ